MRDGAAGTPVWTWLIPSLSLALLRSHRDGGRPWLAFLCGVALVGAVMVAVHHAEVVAHRVGEPFGTLVLALAVTAIETALILSMMLAGGDDMAVLPRDTIYAAVMIICNGVVGVCLLLGGLAHREQAFRVEGAGAGMAALIVCRRSYSSCLLLRRAIPGGLQRPATRVRGGSVGRAVGDLRVHPDGASSRLLHSCCGRLRHGRARRAADAAPGMGELRTAPSSRWWQSSASQRCSRPRSSTCGGRRAPTAVVGILIAVAGPNARDVGRGAGGAGESPCRPA